jgi:hypothetical protein
VKCASDSLRQEDNWRRIFLQIGLEPGAAPTEAGQVKIASPTASHKFGANRNELAATPRKRDPNFRQSRDVREDRGQRRMKTFTAARSLRA